MNNTQPAIGVVIIGRNEGERLIRCMESLASLLPYVLYVDSASTDNSVLSAKSRGIHVVSLDMSKPFTAARARNAGFEKIIALYPYLKFIQFVDGDCEVLDGWIEQSVLFLQNNPQVAIVNGVLKERFPDKTIYNRLCDIEWKTLVGEIKYCGGNALMRVDAFKKVGGFLPQLIAGEEPELCIRLRRSGWKIWHLNQQMMLHDADMTSFFQWWKRTVRCGYAYAEGASIHGHYPDFHWVKESRRAWLWGMVIPIFILIGFSVHVAVGLIFLIIYPIQILRLTLKSQQKIKSAFIHSFFAVVGKFAEMVGQLKFFKQKYLNEKINLIEYK